jgi:hypothetical protein
MYGWSEFLKEMKGFYQVGSTTGSTAGTDSSSTTGISRQYSRRQGRQYSWHQGRQYIQSVQLAPDRAA